MARFTFAVICLFATPGTHAVEENSAPHPAGVGLMLDQLDSDDWILRTEALHYLTDKTVKRAAPQILSIAENESTDPWSRGRALVSLARFEITSAPEMADAFSKSNEPILRSAAADALGEIGGEASVEIVQSLISDEDVSVRYRALASFARIRGEDAWEKVNFHTEALDEKNYESGTRALAWVGNSAALERISTLIANGEGLNRIIKGIATVPNPDLIDLLIQIIAAHDTEDRTFGAVISALQKHDAEKLATAMEIRLKEGGHAEIKTIAKVMTLSIQSPELGDSLRLALGDEKDVETLRSSLVVLGSRAMQPDRHIDLFTAHLNHGDSEIRSLAIRCLAHCDDANLFNLLKGSIADEDPTVAKAALGVLLRAPIDTAPRGRLVDYLQEPLSGESPSTRAMAFELLGHAGGPEDFRPAMAMLGPLLRGKDSEKRIQAAEALGEIAPANGIREVVQSQGFIADWWVLGTFLNDEKNSSFEKVFAPEEEIDLEAKYMANYVWVIAGQRLQENTETIEREIGWSEINVDRTGGKLMMASVLPPPGSYSVGYAVADFDATGGDYLLEIDGDDAFRVWVNGEKVAEAVAEFKDRSPSIAERKGVAVKLKEGKNRILLKSANINHEWWVRVRLTDPKGTPVEISAP